MKPNKQNISYLRLIHISFHCKKIANNFKYFSRKLNKLQNIKMLFNYISNLIVKHFVKRIKNDMEKNQHALF